MCYIYLLTLLYDVYTGNGKEKTKKQKQPLFMDFDPLKLNSFIIHILIDSRSKHGEKGVGRNHLGNESSPKPASNAFI